MNRSRPAIIRRKPQEDVALVADIVAKGDMTATEALIKRYQSRTYNLAVSMVDDREDARDLTQEILIADGTMDMVTILPRGAEAAFMMGSGDCFSADGVGPRPWPIIQ